MTSLVTFAHPPTWLWIDTSPGIPPFHYTWTTRWSAPSKNLSFSLIPRNALIFFLSLNWIKKLCISVGFCDILLWCRKRTDSREHPAGNACNSVFVLKMESQFLDWVWLRECVDGRDLFPDPGSPFPVLKYKYKYKYKHKYTCKHNYNCNATTGCRFGLLERVRGSVLTGSCPRSRCDPPHSQKPDWGCISNPFPGQSYSMHNSAYDGSFGSPPVPDGSRQGSALPACQMRCLQSPSSSKPENR